MTFTPIQPMEAPDYEESSKVLTNPMQAVFDSAAKDAETAETNANRNSQTAEALGAFSKSLNDLATTAADKYIKEREAAGLDYAMTNGTIPQDVVDQHDAEVDKMEKDSNSIQKLAAKIEENDDHDIVSERVRSADPYYQYYYKLGKLRQMVGERITDGAYTDDNRTEATLKRILTSDTKPAIYTGRTLSDELKNFVGCFLTGTAAEVTPVSCIAENQFKVCETIIDLNESYQALVRKKKAA